MTPSTAAVARPSKAPISGAAVLPAELMPAHRNSAVSAPSRTTATKATIVTATALVASARSISPLRCALMPLARDAIQKTIHVIRPTAMSDIVPAKAGSMVSPSVSSIRMSTAPNRADTPMAAPTPIQTCRRA